MKNDKVLRLTTIILYVISITLMIVGIISIIKNKEFLFFILGSSLLAVASSTLILSKDKENNE